jgi:NAD(P)-dependent dehydrogenase (short-subunit alcohol dehydrogenase family)
MNGSALVTGASRGIGRATALEFARRGVSTIATMRDVRAGESLIAEAQGCAGDLRVEHLDVNDVASISIDHDVTILVNNAGVETENESIEHGDVDAHWKYLFEANVFGLVRVTQRAIPVLRANGGGVICNVTSSSILAPVPFLGMYRASKAAVMALGESLAAEVAQFGIRVVEVMPGPIVTDMLAASERRAAAGEHLEYAHLADAMWQTRQQIIDQYTSAEEAARRIVDACTQSVAPHLMRVGCDDMAESMVNAWKHTPHDTMIQSIIEYYAAT